MIRALVDHDFWRIELEEPSFIVMNKLAPVSHFIEGDHRVEGWDAPATHAVFQKDHDPVPPQPAPKAGVIKNKRGGNGGSKFKAQADAEGKRSQNSKGIKLCDGYNTGTCKFSMSGTSLCSTGSGESHQCSICLRNDHGAWDHEAAMQRSS